MSEVVWVPITDQEGKIIASYLTSKPREEEKQE